ncbi:hypothetical protein [Humidesulfovibrio sp.]
MRRALFLSLSVSTLILLVGLAPGALAEPPAILRVQPGDEFRPGHAAWPLGQRVEHGARVSIAADAATADTAEPTPAQSFRIDIAPLPGQGPAPAAPRACLGLASAARHDLYKTRAVEFRIRALVPAAGIVVVTSSNTQNRAARDRFFGSFVIGTQWKTLRLPYGALAPLPGWDAQARAQGFSPGDHVLRPDSVEDLCIGVEAARLPESGQGVRLWIDSLRFVR